MRITSLSLVVFAASYFPLRMLKNLWEKQQLPVWSRPVTGFFAWVSVVAAAGVAVAIGGVIVELMTKPSYATAFTLIGMAFGAIGLMKYLVANPELLDIPSMKPFIKDALVFADLSRRRENVFEELDKYEVRRVYKEVTGKDLVETGEHPDKYAKRRMDTTSGREWKEDGVARAPSNLRQILDQPIASARLNEEMTELGKGKSVDITDSWKINSLRRSPHPLAAVVSRVIVHPGQSLLSFDIQSEQINETQVASPPRLFRLKQDLYDFLQAVRQESWIQPYWKFVATVSCTCAHIEDDAFTGKQTTPLFTIEITARELEANANRFYNVGELRTTLCR